MIEVLQAHFLAFGAGFFLGGLFGVGLMAALHMVRDG